MATDDPELTPDVERSRWKGGSGGGPPPLPSARARSGADAEVPSEPVPAGDSPQPPPFSGEKPEPSPPPADGPAAPPAATDRIDSPAVPEALPDDDDQGLAPDEAFDEYEEEDTAWFHVGRRTLRNSLSFLVSMVFHLVLVLALGLWVMPPPEVASVLNAVVVDVEPDFEPELETVELDQQEQASTTLNFQKAAGDPLSGPQSANLLAVERVNLDQNLMEQLDQASDVPNVDIDGLSDFNFKKGEALAELPADAPGEARAIVDGYSEAMDRITQEILQMLYGGPVLVIWCFDRSESMKDDQEEIAARIKRVYDELGLSTRASGGALKTAITSFGETFAVQTPEPTHDPAVIQAAIGSLPVDPSGKEYMCQAVARSLVLFEDYARRTRRRIMLVLVADESGERQDNINFLEGTIQKAKDVRCRVYVLGREAVFGYPYVRFRYRHPQTRRVHWLLADRGPESAFVEQLQTNGFRRRHDAFGSGFGPYEQSRLARQTGGIFFLLPSVEASIVRGEKRRYELQQLRRYKPDLRAREEIFFDRDETALRLMLWKIIHDLDPHNKQAKDVTEVRVHFSPDPRQFVTQMNTQIPRAKILVGYLGAAATVLEQNRELRSQETEVRWQANYDLLLAQLVAYQARLYEYTAYLQYFMQNPQVVPLTKPPNLRLTYWDIRTRTETISGEVIDPYVAKATELFKAIIEDHPGTPWAERARWELRRGYGVDLKPVYEPPYVKVSNPKPLPKL